MKKLLIAITALLLLLLSSCELFYPGQDKNIYLVSVAMDYKRTGIKTLNCTLNDQKAIRSQLKLLSEKAVYNFAEIAITAENGNTSVYSDFARTTEKTSIKQQLIEAIDTIGNTANDNDITIFYYSGHGAGAGELGLELASIPLMDSRNPYITGKPIPEDSYMLPEELIPLFSGIRGKKLLIMDSCYSGNYVQEEEFLDSSIAEAFSSLLSSPKYNDSNIWVMAASQRIQRSWEADPTTWPLHGYFTKALLTLLGYDTETGTTTGNVHGIISYLKLAKKIPSLMVEVKQGYENGEGEQYPLYTSTTKDLVLFDF